MTMSDLGFYFAVKYLYKLCKDCTIKKKPVVSFLALIMIICLFTGIMVILECSYRIYVSLI